MMCRCSERKCRSVNRRPTTHHLQFGRAMCSTVYSVRDFLREPGHRAWIWDHLTESWARLLPARATPGQMVMVSSDSGGYSADYGWAPKSADPVPALSTDRRTPSGAGNDHGSSRPWQTIAQHTDLTVLEVRGIVHALHGLLEDWIVDSLIAAARAHDWGKAHPVFRETLLNSGRQAKSEPPLLPGSSESGLLWAKAPGTARHSRKHFRHELAGALALIKLPHLASAVSPKANPDLVAYLVASHHGRVRLAIRSLPGDWIPRRSVRSALGVQDGDKLPECDVGGRIVLPEVVIDMTPMEMGISTSGDASWASRMMALRDCTDLGPFDWHTWRRSYALPTPRRASVPPSTPEVTGIENGAEASGPADRPYPHAPISDRGLAYSRHPGRPRSSRMVVDEFRLSPV